MHIPDGFVSGPVNILGALTAVGVVGFSSYRASREAEQQPHTVPLLATTGAFVFAAQMLNFPIGAGTSGHFLGAAAVAALLGPWRACLVMTLVVLIQGLVFSDGGLTALGTNMFNMAVVGVFGAYLVMRVLRLVLPTGRVGYLAAAAAAGWVSVVLASAACAFELALSGTSPLLFVMPAMIGVHAIIGVGEALITCAVLSAVVAARPDVVPAWADVDPTTDRQQSGKRVWQLAGAGLALALLLAALVSPLASAFPDGLEKVTENNPTEQVAKENDVWTGALMPDYKVPAVATAEVSTGLAGLCGTMAVFIAGFGIVKLLGVQSVKRKI